MRTAACTGDVDLFFSHVDESKFFAHLASHTDGGSPEMVSVAWRKSVKDQRADFCGWDFAKTEDIDGGQRIEANSKKNGKISLFFADVGGQLKLVDFEVGKLVAPAEPVDMTVDVAELLKDYKDNELRGDNKYKGKRIRVVNGKAGEFKRDVTNSIFMTVGTGTQFESPEAQCFFREEHASEIVSLRKGADVVVNCTVEGLMMNVLMKDCSFPDTTTFNVCSKLYHAGIAEDCDWLNGPEESTGFIFVGGAGGGIVQLLIDDSAFTSWTSQLEARGTFHYVGSRDARIVVFLGNKAPSPDALRRVKAVLDHLTLAKR